MGSEIIDLKPHNLLPPAPIQKDTGKRWIRLDLDLLTKQMNISGHIYDKNMAINMLADAMKTVMNLGTRPVEPHIQEGHS